MNIAAISSRINIVLLCVILYRHHLQPYKREDEWGLSGQAVKQSNSNLMFLKIYGVSGNVRECAGKKNDFFQPRIGFW
jgi:hypothetical protein